MNSIIRTAALPLFITALIGCASHHPKSAPTAQRSAMSLPSTAAQLPEDPAAPAQAHSTYAASASAPSSSQEAEAQPLSADRQRFATEVSQRYQLNPQKVQSLLAEAQIDPTTLKLMTPKPKTGNFRKHWESYRKRFVEAIRIRKGTAFWNEHRRDLAQAEQRYGVPASIITAIIGVETVYGSNMGNVRLLDSLYTLGFHHPDASKPERHLAFRNQLASLINLHANHKLDARTTMGSYAGATGLPQFMPVSIEHFAVDGDGDGHIDLANSPQDAIFSVANFLRMHGWQPGMPVFAPVKLPEGREAALVDGGLEPNLSWSALQAAGATSSATGESWQQGESLGVIDLADEVHGNTQYRTATRNFFAITKYNHSYFYAASVADLAQELAARQAR